MLSASRTTKNPFPFTARSLGAWVDTIVPCVHRLVMAPVFTPEPTCSAAAPDAPSVWLKVSANVMRAPL